MLQLRSILSGWGHDESGDEEDGDGELEENVEVVPRELTAKEELIAVCGYLRRVGEISETLLSGVMTHFFVGAGAFFVVVLPFDDDWKSPF